MGIPARILDAEATSEYQGSVYAQRVVVDIADGTTIGIFDPNVLVTEGMLGQCAELDVTILVDTVERTTGERRRIVPSAENPRGWRGHTYEGKVTSLSVDRDSVTVQLDVGAGTVEFQRKRRLVPDVETGDTLAVTARRTDLRSVAE